MTDDVAGRVIVRPAIDLALRKRGYCGRTRRFTGDMCFLEQDHDGDCRFSPGFRLRPDAPRRQDAHNLNVDPELSRAGLCGVVHLATGRKCRLPRGHQHGCHFSHDPGVPTPVGAS